MFDSSHYYMFRFKQPPYQLVIFVSISKIVNLDFISEIIVNLFNTLRLSYIMMLLFVFEYDVLLFFIIITQKTVKGGNNVLAIYCHLAETVSVLY